MTQLSMADDVPSTTSSALTLPALVSESRSLLSGEGALRPTERAALEGVVARLSAHTSSTSADVASCMEEEGYEVLHDLLPLLSPASIAASQRSFSAPPLAALCGALLHAVCAHASPREIFLPLLSHTSSHVSALSSATTSPSAEAVSESVAFVSFLLPSFLTLLTRERHARRRAEMLSSLWGTLFVTAFALSPTDSYLSQLLSPLLPQLSPAAAQDVAIPLAYLAVYLPAVYPTPIPPPPVVASLVSFLAACPLLSLPTLVQYMGRRQQLEAELRRLRLDAWDVTEDTEAEMKRMTEEAAEAGGDGWDDTATDDSVHAQQQQQHDQQQRAELRAVRAELGTLPALSMEGATCYLLLLILLSSQPFPLSSSLPSVTAYVHALPPSQALAALLPCVHAVVHSAALQRRPAMFVDLARAWLAAVESASLTFADDDSAAAEADQATWLLAEAVTTSMAHGHGLGSTTSPSLLALLLDCFQPASRVPLMQRLITQCPYPAVQAVLISRMKDLSLSSSSPSSSSPLTPSTLSAFLLSLLSTLARPDAPPLVDPLLAALNVFRFLLLRAPPEGLSLSDRRDIAVGVRLLQRELQQHADAQQSSKVEDVHELLLRDVLVRVLELL